MEFFQFQILLNQINVDFKFNAPIVFANTNECYQNATLTPHSCSILFTTPLKILITTNSTIGN